MAAQRRPEPFQVPISASKGIPHEYMTLAGTWVLSTVGRALHRQFHDGYRQHPSRGAGDGRPLYPICFVNFLSAPTRW